MILLSTASIGVLNPKSLSDSKVELKKEKNKKNFVELNKIKVDKNVIKKANLKPNEFQRMILIFDKKPKYYKNFIRSLNGKVTHDFDIVESIAVWLPGSAVERLTKLENLISIHEDKEVHAFLSESVPLINAVDVWGLGYNGSGKTVCVVDTGIDYNHPALAGKVIAQKDFVNNDNDAMDDHGHGTHVSGIIASQDNTDKGVSPGADLMAVKVLDSTGSGYGSDVIMGIQWCSAQNADVISMSLGVDCNSYPEYCYDIYCDNEPDAQAVNNAVDAGSVVSVASGNDVKTTMISSPACASKAISVGATTKSDQVTSYTNRDEILDLLAPGTSITSTKLGGGFVAYSGTSMATPHVSGAAALLLEKNPNLTPAQVEGILKFTGVSIYDNESGLTFPRIDILDGINFELGHLEPYLIDPTTDANVTKNKFFSFSTGVKCVDGYCGNVTAILDPETELYYDDNNPYYYYIDSNFIWAVRFTAPFDPLTIIKAKVMLYDPNTTGSYSATVYVYEDNNGIPGNELVVFNTTTDSFYPDWEVISLDVSLNDQDFWIGITAPGEPDGPYVLSDNGTATYRSYASDDGNSWYDLDEDLLLRAFVKERKGIIPMNNGTPFYTINQNPVICANMTNQSTCNQTWIVNATGEINSSWLFYTVYDSNFQGVETKITDKVNVTIIEGILNFDIPLYEGWNLISIPLILENNSINYIFNNINYSKIFSYVDGKWIELSDNDKINETMGLWIKMNNSGILELEGTIAENITVNLIKGQNLIGYPSLEEKNVDIVFENVNDSLISVLSYENNTWFSYSPIKLDELNTLKIMKPGFGYWINVNENTNLAIPK